MYQAPASLQVCTVVWRGHRKQLCPAVDYKEPPPTSLLNEKDIQLFVQALKMTCISVYDVITPLAGHHLSVCLKTIFL